MKEILFPKWRERKDWDEMSYRNGGKRLLCTSWIWWISPMKSSHSTSCWNMGNLQGSKMMGTEDYFPSWSCLSCFLVGVSLGKMAVTKIWLPDLGPLFNMSFFAIVAYWNQPFILRHTLKHQIKKRQNLDLYLKENSTQFSTFPLLLPIVPAVAPEEFDLCSLGNLHDSRIGR